MNHTKYTTIYGDFKDGKLVYCVRITPLETPKFPHGIGVRGEFDTKEEARDFGVLIDEYIDAFVSTKTSEQ